MMQPVPRPEYPRPQFRRPQWVNLNGEWWFAFDDEAVGLGQRWPDVAAPDLGTPRSPFDRRITVPYCYQASLSGIGETGLHDVVWYARSFDPPRGGYEDERVLVHFGAVDYWASAWVNGICVAYHEGGHTPFSADVTPALRDRDNMLVVRAEDPSGDLTIPRGKQYWKQRPEGIFYTPTTGIWQTVWLEPVPRTRIDRLRLTPDADRAMVDIEVEVTAPRPGLSVRLAGRLGDTVVFDDVAEVRGSVLRRGIPLTGRRFVAHKPRARDRHGLALWSPESPNLYDLRVELRDRRRQVLDTVDSYFGVRKIETKGGKVYLNDRPYCQRLVLDQGYWPGGLLTAPGDDDLRRDIELAKELGFDGARKHQKVEDPRWLYWADRLGFLVWEEMANAHRYSPEYVARITGEWQAVVRRDYNHPAVVAWIPVNESWGVPDLATDPAQVAHLLSLYHLTRSLDGTRVVIANDGWEHAATDLLTLHDYGRATALRKRYASTESSVSAEPADRPAYAPGCAYEGEPILVTEFGGVALDQSAARGWGHQRVRNADQLAQRYEELVGALLASDVLQGFCYTQLTDVQQETNGLLTHDREHKADPARIRAATTGRRPGSGS